MLSRRRFLLVGLTSAAALVITQMKVLPNTQAAEGELRIHLVGTKKFSTAIPYDCQVQEIDPNTPDILIESAGTKVTQGSRLYKGDKLSVNSITRGTELTIKVQKT